MGKLEGQVASNRKESSNLEAEQKEVTGVKECMLQAQRLEASEGAAASVSKATLGLGRSSEPPTPVKS